MKNGLLLINLGTPSTADVYAVRRYLREFLSDRRVITLPWPIRMLLLYAFILPFRTKKTTRAYQAIWTEHGSPLRTYSEQLCQKLKTRLSGNFQVELGMRYGTPSLNDALAKLKNCEKLVVLPLYPQYASSSSGSAIEATLAWLKQQVVIPHLHIIRDFYHHPAYIKAQIDQLKPYIQDNAFILFSYHGLPEQHLNTIGCQPICTNECPIMHQNTPPHHHACYRAQCYTTTRAIATGLNLAPSTYQTCFQSRLGRAPWIQPYFDEQLPKLYQQGIRNLIVTSPSFVTDCLETLEEIAIRAKQQWEALGGESFVFVPSLNAKEQWVEAIATMVET